MGRPAKPIGVAVGARTKDEIEGRAAAEEKLKGNAPPRPPKNLNKEQKKIFREIVKRLQDADILCALDDYIDLHPGWKYITGVMNARAKYTQDFYRGCNELGLSPQARAKMAISLSKQEEDPLTKLLAGDGD